MRTSVNGTQSTAIPRTFSQFVKRTNFIWFVCNIFSYFPAIRQKCQCSSWDRTSLTWKVTTTRTICFPSLQSPSLPPLLYLQSFGNWRGNQKYQNLSLACLTMSTNLSKFPSRWQFLPPPLLSTAPIFDYRLQTNCWLWIVIKGREVILPVKTFSCLLSVRPRQTGHSVSFLSVKSRWLSFCLFSVKSRQT